jgi:hypothetical protein
LAQSDIKKVRIERVRNPKNKYLPKSKLMPARSVSPRERPTNPDMRKIKDARSIGVRFSEEARIAPECSKEGANSERAFAFGFPRCYLLADACSKNCTVAYLW